MHTIMDAQPVQVTVLYVHLIQIALNAHLTILFTLSMAIITALINAHQVKSQVPLWMESVTAMFALIPARNAILQKIAHPVHSLISFS